MRFIIVTLLIFFAGCAFSQKILLQNLEQGASSYTLQLGPKNAQISIDISYYVPKGFS